MNHYVYIIESVTSGNWYYGYSTDLEKRLDGHNKGLNVSTKNRGPWKYIFVKRFETKKEVRGFESYIKKKRNKGYAKRQFFE